MQTRKIQVGNVTLEYTPISNEQMTQLYESCNAIFKNLIQGDFKATNQYTNQLQAVTNEYSKTIEACKKTSALQDEILNILQNQRYGEFPSKFHEAREQFRALQSQLKSQIALKLHQIPPIPADLSVPSAHLEKIREGYNNVVSIKNAGDKFYKNVELINKAVVDAANKLVSAKNEILAQQNPSSIEAKPSSAPKQPPLSSSHGSQYAAAKMRSEQANSNESSILMPQAHASAQKK